MNTKFKDLKINNLIFAFIIGKRYTFKIVEINFTPVDGFITITYISGFNKYVLAIPKENLNEVKTHGLMNVNDEMIPCEIFSDFESFNQFALQKESGLTIKNKKLFIGSELFVYSEIDNDIKPCVIEDFSVTKNKFGYYDIRIKVEFGSYFPYTYIKEVSSLDNEFEYLLLEETCIEKYNKLYINNEYIINKTLNDLIEEKIKLKNKEIKLTNYKEKYV